jgi:transposase-like protein
LSASAIGRLKDGWLDEHTAWQRRDLSAKRYVYIWADGIHLQARLEDEKQCILVLIGATPEGRKELVGFTDGARESAQDWRDLLLDLKRRGLDVPPRLTIADGALGFWKAAGENARAVSLGAQDLERARQVAEEPAAEGQTCIAGNLDGRNQGRRKYAPRCARFR